MVTGIIDDMESKHFTEMFKEKNSELNRKGLVPSPLPGVAIRGIPWIGGDQGICNYLYVSNIIGLSSFKT